MKIFNEVVILFFLCIFFSCNEKVVNIYDEDGSITQTRIFLEDAVWQVITFYPDGTKKEKGKIKKEVRFGEWVEWYSDSIEKWSGLYIDGERDISVYQQSPKVLIDKEKGFLNAGIKNSVKVIVKGLHPDDAVYATNNGQISACVHDDANDIYLIPEKKGSLRLMVYALAFQEDLFIGETTLEVK